MTYDDAVLVARAAFEAANPHLDVPSRDFTVASAAFDAIEARLSQRQGVILRLPDDPADGRVDHVLFMGHRMYRGGDGRP